MKICGGGSLPIPRDSSPTKRVTLESPSSYWGPLCHCLLDNSVVAERRHKLSQVHGTNLVQGNGIKSFDALHYTHQDRKSLAIKGEFVLPPGSLPEPRDSQIQLDYMLKMRGNLLELGPRGRLSGLKLSTSCYV